MPEPGTTPTTRVDDRPGTAGGRFGWASLAIVLVLLAGVIVTTLVGGRTTPSGDGASGTGGPCAPSVEEPLDPTSAQRLLPNAAEPRYASDPPTSGAFVVGAQSPPVSDEPLSRPVQVGLLSQGKVLVQYRDLGDGDLAAVRQLAGDDVVVAPNPTLPSSVMATAWRQRQTCTGVDLDALRRFATLHANQAPQAGVNGTTTTGR